MSIKNAITNINGLFDFLYDSGFISEKECKEWESSILNELDLNNPKTRKEIRDEL